MASVREEGFNLQGQTIVVTGANSGIGYETALGVASMGARVGLVCRERARGEAAQEAIMARAGHSNVDLFVADLSSRDQVSRLTGEILAAYERLDTLVNNAGLFLLQHEMSPDGRELTMAVNHLAPFQLTIGLFELLRESAPSRVIAVTSGVIFHDDADINLDDLDRGQGYQGLPVYNESKLANVLFAEELTRRTAGSGVVSISFNPGAVATRWGYNNRGPAGEAFRNYMASQLPDRPTPEVGAAPLVRLVADPGVLEQGSAYYDRGELAELPEVAQDEERARRLWELSAEFTGVDLPS